MLLDRVEDVFLRLSYYISVGRKELRYNFLTVPPSCPHVSGQEREESLGEQQLQLGSFCWFCLPALVSLVGTEVLRPVRTKRFPDLIAESLLLVLPASFSFSWWERGFSRPSR